MAGEYGVDFDFEMCTTNNGGVYFSMLWEF